MVVRWVSAAIVEAEKKFRRVQGWRDIEKLVRALALLEDKEEATAERVAWDRTRSRRSVKINSARDNPRVGLRSSDGVGRGLTVKDPEPPAATALTSTSTTSSRGYVKE